MEKEKEIDVWREGTWMLLPSHLHLRLDRSSYGCDTVASDMWSRTVLDMYHDRRRNRDVSLSVFPRYGSEVQHPAPVQVICGSEHSSVPTGLHSFEGIADQPFVT